MMSTGTDQQKEQGKIVVAEAVAAKVESNARIGIGAGSTVYLAIKAIGKRITDGEIENISCLPASEITEKLARENGINILTKEEVENEQLDWAFDGADEVVTSTGFAIKGGGGAMTKEKEVAKLTDKLILIVDESKVSKTLQTSWPSVPIEVKSDSKDEVFEKLESLGAESFSVREKDGNTFITEYGNHIIDVVFKSIDGNLESKINKVSGVIENGLFTISGISLASEVLVAENGKVSLHTINA